MKRKKKKKKAKEATVTLSDLVPTSPVAEGGSSTRRCKLCVSYGKDVNKTGICKKTKEHVARNHSCQKNFKKKKKPSTSASSDA